MLPNLLKSLCRFSTVERPFSPAHWNTMSIRALQSLPEQGRLEGVVHAMRLMEGGLTPFDYDFYQWSCWRVVEQQQRLTKEEILMMLRLAHKYRITLEPFHLHIENQIFLRVHRDYQPQLQLYDESIKKDMAQLMQKLEEQSRDYFNLLQEGEEDATNNAQQEQQEQNNQNEQKEAGDFQVAQEWASKAPQTQAEKFIIDMNRKLKKRTEKEFSLSDLVEVMGLLRATGSKNISLLQYILQLLTIHYEALPQVDASQVVSYLQAITFVCQQLMAEYSGNRSRYTARSIKRIFKFQTLYYHEHIRQLASAASSLSLAQLHQLVSAYAAFPLKRRAIRRSIGGLLGQEVKRRQLQETDFVKALVEINRKDEKMKKSYCEMMGIDLQKAKSIGLYKEQQKALQVEEKDTAEKGEQENKGHQQATGKT